MKALQKITTLLTGQTATPYQPKHLTKRQLIEIESEQGATIFGPVAAGHRREFFRLDDHTWVWYEEWKDEHNKKQSRTTRYELHSSGILKVQDNGMYSFIEGEELHNLSAAVQAYYERVMRNVYRRDPTSGQPLTAQPATI
ncbi:MAG: hypothetical protein WAU02_03210 [Candidatus Saccharimonadales bacterium]